MAKYSVTYKCGCAETVQLFGPHKERDRKLAWFETVPCRACKEKQDAAAPVEIEFVVVGQTLRLQSFLGKSYAHRGQFRDAGYSWDGDHWIMPVPGKAETVQQIEAAMDRGWIVFRRGARVTAEQIAALKAAIAQETK